MKRRTFSKSLFGFLLFPFIPNTVKAEKPIYLGKDSTVYKIIFYDDGYISEIKVLNGKVQTIKEYMDDYRNIEKLTKDIKLNKHIYFIKLNHKNGHIVHQILTFSTPIKFEYV